ncbi:pilus assembly protein HofM [Chimaeribacter californicus]|uniref:Pilus assembly protein HofM n=1 Tax=Chimaeribacter californicus TaxID=2060067 RepID=A0A2N5E4D5_9GAMM|nr:pilus assembly protein PilM [Chimaeribacter californicus]PLR35833.1 pilus assembly protein HofM [Chimaeribacter californicus]
MAGEKWQIGLDIQPHAYYAVAVARQRGGWQLRGCWHQLLPGHEPLSSGLPVPEIQTEALRRWRAGLPRRFSLRVALPAARVLQRTLPAPAPQLREPHREAFLLAQAARLFPLDRDALVFDYRTPSGQPEQVLVTAAHRQELAAWLALLQQAGLQPDAVDIPPCALHYIGELAGIPAEALMLHHLRQGWVWVSPRDRAFQFGIIDAAENAGDVLAALPAALHALPCFFSSALGEPVPDGMHGWSPFSRLLGAAPAESEPPGAFALAAGLAVRPEDRE